MMESNATATDELLRLSDAAAESKRVRISKAWLLKEAREGRLRHYRVGRRVLLDPRDVDARIAAYEIPVS